MAIQLPTFSDLGTVAPQPTPQQPAFPQSDAVAQGEANLGAGVEKAGGALEDVAAYSQMARNRMDRAMAESDFTNRIEPITTALDTETDPAKITALRGQFQQALATSAQAIGDPTARQLWMLQMGQHVAAGEKHADLRNAAIYKDRYKAGIEEQLTNTYRMGASSSDPAAFPLAQGNIDRLTQAAVDAGQLTATEAFAMKQAATKQLVEGRALNLSNNADPDVAKAFLKAHASDINPITAEGLSARIDRRADKAATVGLVNSIWGGADNGRAGNLARPGEPSAGDPRGMIPVITAAAQKYGVDPAVALKVARSEGLGEFVGDNGTSFGAFQLHTSGGLGDEFKRDTGLDPSDPKNEPATIDYAMRRLADTGWTPYHGAARVGVSANQGIGTEVAQADTGTMTDAVPDQAPAAAAPAPLPDIDAMTQRVQDMADSGQITQERANAAMGMLRARYNHVQAAQANDRAALAKQLNNGIAMLADGRDFDWDEATIRHFFPKDKADDIVQQLQDAKDGGALVAGTRLASPDQIDQQRDALEKALSDPNATDYAKRRRLLTMFDTAQAQRDKLLTGPDADPVSYLAEFDPVVQQKQQAIDPNNPQTFSDYATAALSEQDRLGVPRDQQHVLSINLAGQIAAEIGADPQKAPDTIRAMANRYGQAWPNVWGDLITLGKLPAGYQVVGQLADYDKANASILAKTLNAPDKDLRAFASSPRGPGNKTVEQTVNEAIGASNAVTKYAQSLTDSGANPGQVVSIRNAIRDLAIGRAMFAKDDVANASQEAIDAVVGHYEFMPNGGARVPKDNFSVVQDNAAEILRGLTPEKVTISPIYGSSPAAPKPQEYLDMVRAAPTWITGPKADRLLLIDPAGRAVIGKDGQPVSVPFDMPRLAPPAPPTQADILSQDER